MRRVEPQLRELFSREQWIKIAKSISRNEIPRQEQLEVYYALIAYDFARTSAQRAAEAGTRRSTRLRVDPRAKGRKVPEQFVQYARGLRGALNSIQPYLKQSEYISKAENLIEDIYHFQRFAERELKTQFTEGRKQDLEVLVHRLGAIYERITNKKPGLSVNRKTGRPEGPFFRFVSAIFEAGNIPLPGLSHVIAKIAKHAKNRR